MGGVGRLVVTYFSVKSHTVLLILNAFCYKQEWSLNVTLPDCNCYYIQGRELLNELTIYTDQHILENKVLLNTTRSNF